MKHMTYGQKLAFRHEYWLYLTAEKCDCTEEHHEKCHARMADILEAIDAWKMPGDWLVDRVLERMTEFQAFTQNPELKHFAGSVIERINFIEQHKLSCGVPSKAEGSNVTAIRKPRKISGTIGNLIPKIDGRTT